MTTPSATAPEAQYPPPVCWIAVGARIPDSAVYGAGDTAEAAIDAAVARPIAAKGRSNYRALQATERLLRSVERLGFGKLLTLDWREWDCDGGRVADLAGQDGQRLPADADAPTVAQYELCLRCLRYSEELLTRASEVEIASGPPSPPRRSATKLRRQAARAIMDHLRRARAACAVDPYSSDVIAWAEMESAR